MIISKQIYTGEAGEGGWFLKHAATAASTSQVNVKQQAHWLLTQKKQLAAPCDDVIVMMSLNCQIELDLSDCAI